jgi:hypothetical protein
MALPAAIQTLWDDLQAVRASVLHEVEGLSQHQADWKPTEKEWSVGELIHHLTLAEIATGKLTTKLTREAEAAGKIAPFPADLRTLAPLPSRPDGGTEAPPVVAPQHGNSIGELVEGMRAARERSRQSIEKLGSVDPRRLVFKHFHLGELDLAQWWQLQAHHDRVHLAQLRAVKATTGFPAR